VQDITFPKTAGWLAFSSVIANVALNAGNNTIKVQTDAGDVLSMDIDCFLVNDLTIANPGFETGNINGWTEWHSGTVAYGVDGNNPHSGRYKAYFWTSGAYGESLHQLKTGLTNGSYTVKVWINYSITPATTARLELGNYGGSTIYTNFSFNGVWTQYSSTVNVTNGQLDIGLYCNSAGNSSMAMDDIVLIKN